MLKHRQAKSSKDQIKKNTIFGANFQHLEVFEAGFNLCSLEKSRKLDMFLPAYDKVIKQCEEKKNQLIIANAIIDSGWRNILISCNNYQKEFQKALKEGEIAPIIDKITKQTIFPLADYADGSEFVEHMITSQRKAFESYEKFFVKNFNRQVLDEFFGRQLYEILECDQLLKNERKKFAALPQDERIKPLEKMALSSIDSLQSRYAKLKKAYAKTLADRDTSKVLRSCKTFLSAFAKQNKAGKFPKIKGLQKIQFFQTYVNGVKLIKSILSKKS